ncbi:MAG: YajQ family cyclic di-GMP-binding protein [Planctomycetes bacterium]|nr:YajQ family cyclic di-GMP-binding protein [Planctomycetota bacterium]
MASEYSFDIGAEVDMNEMVNAHQFALKQIGNRYDFKGKTAEITLEKADKKIVFEGSEEYVVEAMIDIFQTQLAKRGVDLKALEKGNKDTSPKGDVRLSYTIRDSMSGDEAKEITKAVKNAKIKVNASIQGDKVRVTGKSKDDLQAVQKLVRELDLGCPITFSNYR